ncbi:MAG: septal ring lytic transglycosylase RlpA family protein [Blastocatellia bacterium]|nr:septal ring lytic transglycosylase RlpA family protein [Blastocatellia bacterium]
MAKAESGSKKGAARKPAAKKGGDKKAPAKKSAAAKSATEKSDAKKPAAKEAATVEEAKVETASPAPQEAAQEAPAAEEPQLPASHGKVAVFGGPKDRGIKPDDKLALPTGKHFVYERVRSLNPRSFYCAMRWDYHVEGRSPEEGKRWWANKKLLVTNAKNGNAVIVRAVDYGPHENTGLDIGLSPGAAEALGVEAGDEVDIAFADQKAPTGPVEKV